MSIFGGKEVNSLEDLLVWELQDIYDAEQRLVDALPRMADAAQSQEVKQAFMQHVGTTKEQITRLETVFHRLGKEPDRMTCQGMKGLIDEGEDVISLEGDPMVKDAALIGAAQRVEHYEIAAYGTCRSFCEQLGRDDCASLLQQTLDEEERTDKELTRIAEESINLKAQHA